LVVPFFVGFFATRMPVGQAAIVSLFAWFIIMTCFMIPGINPGHHFWPLARMLPAMLPGCAVVIPIACVLAYAGMWVKGRANKR
jgi:hypothetical protein